MITEGDVLVSQQENCINTITDSTVRRILASSSSARLLDDREGFSNYPKAGAESHKAL